MKLLKQYVCIRIADMTNVDVGLFDFDADSTIYGFALNADEHVYLRFGGRDDESAETYVNEGALKLALERGLDQHKLWQVGKLEKQPRPAAKFPKDFPDIKRDCIDKNKCVHCHHLGSGKTRQLQGANKLDKQKDLWVYPDIARLGVTLDAQKGLVVKKVDGAAKSAGMKAKDEIVKVAGRGVLTYGDLQERLDKMPADTRTLEVLVKRGDAEETCVVNLPADWRVTNIERRSYVHALEPFPEFWGRVLDDAERKRLGVGKDGMACEVTKFWVKTNAQNAGLQVGDIVYEVDGVKDCTFTRSPTLWIRLNRNAGDTITIKVVRGDKKLEFSFKLKARPW
ncbi:MAG: PDZ domain-containing protein [Planctomycetes bacterium]|nr:PDZ domain-containing protein [Planctomycetota bacterium]